MMLRGWTLGPSKRARKALLRAVGCGSGVAFKLVVAVGIVCAGLLDTHLSPARAQSPSDPKRPVSVAFVRHAVGLWASRIADKSFDVATGRTMEWVAHDSDSTVAAALATGRAQIGFIGEGVAAAAFGRGLDLKVFLAMRNAPECDGLAVSASSPVRADDTKSLARRVIAVPFGSTSHFRLLQSLKHWGASPAGLRLANLQASQIAQAWRRREIDAAAISEPLLSKLASDGRLIPLLDSGGGGGLILLAARADFLDTHTVFLSRLIDLLTNTNGASAGREAKASARADAVNSIAAFSGLKSPAAVAAIGVHQPPPVEEQLSHRWLGGGAGSMVAIRLGEAMEIWRWAGRPGRADADVADVIALEPLMRARSYRR